jgi:o-succinylbenzoate synthase
VRYRRVADVLESIELHPIRIPMRHRFRRVEHREAVLVRGPHGWGEFSPFPEYPPEVTCRWLAAALELACTEIPAPGRDSVEVNVTVPVVAPDVARTIVSESGARTAKVKVGEPGQEESEDIARLEAVASALGPGGRIRVDVNGAWDVETAARRIGEFARFDLEYVEQPVASFEEMRRLRQLVTVPLAADELVRRSPDPLRVVAEEAADILILKVQPMGGVARVLDIARRSSLPVVISSALETSVGMYGGLLAASLLDEPAVCGLNTVSMLEGDVTRDSLVAVDGRIRVRRPEPDLDLLERWIPDRETIGDMLRRLRAAASMLT